MTLARILALVFFVAGCGVGQTIENAAETVACGGWHKVAKYHLPPDDAWPCWRPDPGDCVITARTDVDACSVPDDDDALFAPGDNPDMWCQPFDVENDERHFRPVYCDTGGPVYDEHGNVNR